MTAAAPRRSGRALVRTAVTLVVLALLGCRPLASVPTATALPAIAGAASDAFPPPRTKTGGCVAHDGLPDAACTPGALDPRVTPENVGRTICVPGYTKTVRPPVAVTDAIKRRQIAAYAAYAGADPRGYELDHLISLELGGAPADEANLWPEAHGGPAGSERKDAVENWLHQEVCTGRLGLGEAQRRIATDWRAAYAALPESAKVQVGEGAGEGQ